MSLPEPEHQPALPAPPLDVAERTALLQVAAEAIAFGVQHGRELALDVAGFMPALRQVRATFVTLHLGGELRGCVGTLQASRPLIADAAHHAHAAAFSDPRFAAVSTAEAPSLRLHISILSQPEPIACRTEHELLAQLQPGRDGLILEEQSSTGVRRGTFLPAVWQTLPDPRRFLEHLKRKAGLAPEHWSEHIRAWRYTVESVE